MYQNKATLMGFLGNDAEVRTDHAGRRRVRELITVNGYTHSDQSFETAEIYRASSAAAA